MRPKRRPATPHLDPRSPVSVSALTFAYRKSPPILDAIDLEVDAGEHVAICGPSGAGKSTLLYCIGALLRPIGGAIWVDGVRTTGLREHDLAAVRARSIGFVFQDAMLDQSRRALTSVIEPSLYAGVDRNLAQARGRALLEQLGVGELADRRPGQLSGGQGQRVALARAMALSPRVLLVDEPTGNLDDYSGDIVLDALRSYTQSTGACLVVATHDPRVVDRSDRTFAL